MTANEDCQTVITLLTMIIIISYTKNVRLNILWSNYYFVQYMGYLKVTSALQLSGCDDKSSHIDDQIS